MTTEGGAATQGAIEAVSNGLEGALETPLIDGAAIGTEMADEVFVSGPVRLVDLKDGDDEAILLGAARLVRLGDGRDTLEAEGFVTGLNAGAGDDDVTLGAGAGLVKLGDGADTLDLSGPFDLVQAGRGADRVAITGDGGGVDLGGGDDFLSVTGSFERIAAAGGDDTVSIIGDGGVVRLGNGDDLLTISGHVARIEGGRGVDVASFDAEAVAFDVALDGDAVVLIDRFSRAETIVRDVERFDFADRSLTLEELREDFADDGAPMIMVGGGTQIVTVNDASPTVSVTWDRAVQQAVIDTGGPVGPTVASRAYAMVHTAIYDAWAAFDPVAQRVSFDQAGDNEALAAGLFATEEAKAEAMSFAAHAVLTDLFPDQTPFFDLVMRGLGLDPDASGGRAAQVGLDAAADLLALRGADGSNQAGGYAGEFTPTNPSALEVNDIAAWTPDNVPADPEDETPDQMFLTPQWGGVESFALPEAADGETDFSDILPPPPEPFFAAGFEGSTLNFAAKTITLGAPAVIGGVEFAAGDEAPVTKAMIGVVINEGFIAQAEEVIAFSANLSDRDKIIAEFWEDGGGTAFPPGTFMSFAQFVSARDGATMDEDAALFLAMGAAVFDAGIASWEAKIEYDYVRPARAIRDLGELGLIGEPGVDENTGETGFVIRAFGGFDPETGEGRGTQTILAENFITYQRPFTDPSPPFAEYTSGHSAFSAAGAEVLLRFTGSDEFGGSVAFAPGSAQFEADLPGEEVVLGWETFSEAADESGLSRLYGGIHFEDGDINGRALGRDAGAGAFELAQLFLTGEATDEDRPFFGDPLLF